MKVSDLLESRRENWRELERLCMALEGRVRGRQSPETVARFASLYRAACADLALADAYQLPRGTVSLPAPTGRPRPQPALSQPDVQRVDLGPATAGRRAPAAVPRQRLAAGVCIFWGVFILSGMLSYARPEYAERVVTKEMMAQMEEMYAEPVEGRTSGMGAMMFGFYTFNNPGIGLRCFAMGLLFGVGGLFILIDNAATFGRRVRTHGHDAPERQLLPLRHRSRPLRTHRGRAFGGGGDAAGVFAAGDARA